MRQPETVPQISSDPSAPRGTRLRRIAVFNLGDLVRSDDGYRTTDTFLLMLSGLLDRGVDVDVIARVTDAGEGLQVLDPRIRVLPIAGFRSGWEMYLSRVPAIRASIWRAIRDHCEEWDLIWVVDYNIYTPLILRAASSFGVPAFLYLRGRYDLSVCWPRTRGLRGVGIAGLRAWYRRAIPRATRRVPTVVTGAALGSALAPGAPRTHVFTSTLVHERDVRHERPPRSSGDTKRLLFLGRIHQQKGLETLVRAVAAMREEYRLQVRLIGRAIPDYEQELKELAASLGVGYALEFPGALPFGDQLWAEYAAADVFVLPSLSEGTPKALIEAMAAGLPVIASSVGSIPEMVTDERDALLVRPGDPADLAAALRRVLSDQPLADQLARRAQAQASVLTLERQIDALLRFLSETFELELPDGRS